MKKFLGCIAALCCVGTTFGQFTPSAQCDTGEYNATLPAVQTLYPTRSLTNQASYADDQCNTVATTGTLAECNASCDTKLSGAANTACKTLCSYDVSFASRYVYTPVCTNEYASTIATCMSKNFLQAYCEATAATTCPAYFNAGYCTQAEYTTTLTSVQTLYPNFTLANAINYAYDQCYTAAQSTNIGACKAQCDTKVVGSKNTACKALCDFDADFGGRYGYVCDKCETLTTCHTACSENGFAAPYCQTQCGNSCKLTETTVDITDNLTTTTGANHIYTITAKNIGHYQAENMVASVMLPSGAVFVSASNNGVLSGTSIYWNLGTLASGGIYMPTFVVTLPSQASGSTITLPVVLNASNASSKNASDTNIYTEIVRQGGEVRQVTQFAGGSVPAAAVVAPVATPTPTPKVETPVAPTPVVPTAKPVQVIHPVTIGTSPTVGSTQMADLKNTLELPILTMDIYTQENNTDGTMYENPTNIYPTMLPKTGASGSDDAILYACISLFAGVLFFFSPVKA